MEGCTVLMAEEVVELSRVIIGAISRPKVHHFITSNLQIVIITDWVYVAWSGWLLAYFLYYQQGFSGSLTQGEGEGCQGIYSKFYVKIIRLDSIVTDFRTRHKYDF